MVESSRGVVASLSLLNLFANATRVLLSFFLTVLAARALGATSFGQYNIIIGYTFWLNYIIPLGFDLSLPYFVNAGVKGDLQPNPRQLLIESIKYPAVFGCSLSLLASVVAWFWLESNSLKDLFLPTVLIILQSLFWALGSVLSGYLRAFKAFKPSVIRDQILFPIINLILFVITVRIMLLGLNGLAAAYFGAAFISCLYVGHAAWKVSKEFPAALDKVSTPKKLARERLWRSIPLGFMTVFENMTYWVSIIIIGWFCVPADVGFYSVCLRVAMLTQFFFMAVHPIAAPFLGELFVKADRSEFADLYQVITFWGAKWIVITGFVLASCSDYILTLFGKEFRQGSLLLTVILCGLFLEGMFGVTKHALIMAGRTKLNAINQLISSVINLGFCFILVRAIGPVGGALAFVIGSASLSAARFVQSRKILKVSPLSRQQLTHLSLLLAFFVTIFFLVTNFEVAGDVRLATALLAGGTAAIVSYWGDRHHFTQLLLPILKSRFSKSLSD